MWIESCLDDSEGTVDVSLSWNLWLGLIMWIESCLDDSEGIVDVSLWLNGSEGTV
jgi:hypothetical protein